MNTIARIIDAAANRAREGTRVLEDLARFGAADRSLTAELKALRHSITASVARLPLNDSVLLAWRDTPADPGIAVEGDGEYSRRTPIDVVRAAAGRTQQALRSLEECAKTFPESGASARTLEQARYAMYELERRMVAALPAGRVDQWSVCVLITESLCTHHSWIDVARCAIEAGVPCLQLREKDDSGRMLLAKARQLIGLARPRGVRVIINDRPDVALIAQADGVHVGQTDLGVRDVRRIAGDALVVGVSASTLDQAGQAAIDGADYIGLGPMYQSSTKFKDSLSGPALIERVLADDALCRVPHLAISGIDAVKARALRRMGCRGVAVSSAVCDARDPAQAATDLVNVMSAPSTT